MNVPSDVTFWVVCANTAITALGFAIIKFNDFSHLEKDVSQISKDLKTVSLKVTKIDKKMAVHAEKLSTLEKFK